MQRIMCKTKIIGAVVTDTELDYVGSIGIDADVMRSAGLVPGEQVHVLNQSNGERFITYAMETERKGAIVLYGPAVRKGHIGDKVVILAYAMFDEGELEGYKRNIVTLSGGNTING